MNYEGRPVKVTMATVNMSVHPTVSLGGSEITRPVVLRLQCGSGPVHVGGQHPGAVEGDAESEDDDEEDVNPTYVWEVIMYAPGGGNKSYRKKVKLDKDDEEDDDDDDNFDEKT